MKLGGFSSLLYGFCMNLHSFCMKTVQHSGAKLLILLEGLTTVQLLRAFFKKKADRGASAREDLIHDAGHADD
jgi:hypothetical protein